MRFWWFNRYILTTLILLAAVCLPIQASTVDEVIERGELRVAISAFEPWVIKDEKGNLSGFEIDVAKKVAEDMGVKAVFTLVPWEEIISILENGNVDVIIAGMSITPQRALHVDFSVPYADSGVTIATNTHLTKHIKSLKQLDQADIKIATVSDTVSDKLVASMFSNAQQQQFKTPEDVESALNNGKVHAFVGSDPLPKFMALRHPNSIDAPLSKPLLAYKAAMAVKKGDQALLNYLNAWITARSADAWLSSKHKYWFDSLKWRPSKQTDK